MKFKELISESQLIAREVLVDMLRMKYQHKLSLGLNVVKISRPPCREDVCGLGK